MKVIKKWFLLICLGIPLLFSSCISSDDSDELDQISNKIIGSWIQIEEYNIENANVSPPVYKWVEVEDGFELSFFQNGDFIYTKYSTCFTGTYEVEQGSNRIRFDFDCEVFTGGGSFSSLVGNVLLNTSDFNELSLSPPLFSNNLCQTGCINKFQRVAD